MQKYQRGDRVRVTVGHRVWTDKMKAVDIRPELTEDIATVDYTYAERYGGDDDKSYSLNFDKFGKIAWFREDDIISVQSNQLTMDRKEVFAMLEGVAPECYRIAVSKGWWKDKDDENKKPETTMLILSELGEAINAHRYNQWFPGTIGGRDLWKKEDATAVLNDATGTVYVDSYITFCKGTVEGEIADLTIRLLSYCTAYKCRLFDSGFKKESTKNFGHDLLKLNHWIMEAYHGQIEDKTWFKDWGYCLKAIIVFCDWWKIDIITHVKWRLKYTEFKTDNDGKSY